jgi:2-polyprenyl-3-methyl-5-hydroxy-6-metoxy-1,4-benzoquinol methylase
MQEIPCVLCSSQEYTPVYPSTLEGETLEMHTVRCTTSDYHYHAQIVDCKECGHRYTNPRWTEAELLAAYSAVTDDTYVNEEEGRRLTFERRLAEMQKITGEPGGRTLLDTGAYTGIFVDIAKKAGWNVEGVELSQWCVEQAQAAGLPVTQGTLDAKQIAGKTYDVVTLWDVIEHVDDPAAEVQKAYKHIKPGGYLVMHTMDVDSLISKILGARWPWYVGMHMHFFSTKSLCKLMEREGFTIKKAGPSGRYLRLGYFCKSLAEFMPIVGKPALWLVSILHCGWIPIRLNFGDLITVYGQKKL